METCYELKKGLYGNKVQTIVKYIMIKWSKNNILKIVKSALTYLKTQSNESN